MCIGYNTSRKGQIDDPHNSIGKNTVRQPFKTTAGRGSSSQDLDSVFLENVLISYRVTSAKLQNSARQTFYFRPYLSPVFPACAIEVQHTNENSPTLCNDCKQTLLMSVSVHATVSGCQHSTWVSYVLTEFRF